MDTDAKKPAKVIEPVLDDQGLEVFIPSNWLFCSFCSNVYVISNLSLLWLCVLVLGTVKEVSEESDTDSNVGEGEMVDGIMSSEPKASYKLPSQEELIRLAFAGDDVEEDFEKDKEKILSEENPVPEKPHLLPGWGQWTNLQQKKGLPSWMVEEHENSKKKREEALKKRKDARLKHVIISEKLDKKVGGIYCIYYYAPQKSYILVLDLDLLLQL